MELTAEQKAKLEAPVKAALKALVDCLEQAAFVGAEVSENKIDDMVVPLIEPVAKEQLIKIIDGIKL